LSGFFGLTAGCHGTQAVAALDGAAPAWLGKFTRVGTPFAVNIMSGLIGSAFVIFVFAITKGSLAKFFSVMIVLAISTATLCYTFMMLTLPILRRKYPDVPRPYRVPGGLLGWWVCSVLAELFVIVTGITLLWPGLIDSWFGKSYDMQENWGVGRAFFELTTLGTFIVIVLIGVAFWAIGRRNLRKGIAGEAEVVQALAETERTQAAVAGPGATGPGAAGPAGDAPRPEERDR
jgi:glutamate:GABA antiporter